MFNQIEARRELMRYLTDIEYKKVENGLNPAHRIYQQDFYKYIEKKVYCITYPIDDKPSVVVSFANINIAIEAIREFKVFSHMFPTQTYAKSYLEAMSIIGTMIAKKAEQELEKEKNSKYKKTGSGIHVPQTN